MAIVEKVDGFFIPNVTLIGVGAAKAIPERIVYLNATKPLLVTDKGIVHTGILKQITDILDEAAMEYAIYDETVPNPTDINVEAGAELYRKEECDSLISIGGGSSHDCAKAIALAARYPGDVWEDFWARPGVIDFDSLPLGVIVTVAGTGSECNGGAVITHPGKKIKTGRDYPQLNPRFALMDPTYTYSVPQAQMISGGFDTLSHLMEIYFSRPDEDNVSDDLNEALMVSVIRNLRAAVATPQDYTARSNLMWAATMAENRVVKLGKQGDFQCHNMEHQLGAYTDCNHGQGLAVLHPVYYRHIYQDGLPKFLRFAQKVWGLPRDGRSDEALALAGIEALAGFIRDLGLPTTLRQLGVEREQLKEIADSCGISPGSYRRMTHQEILELFQECYESPL